MEGMEGMERMEGTEGVPLSPTHHPLHGRGSWLMEGAGASGCLGAAEGTARDGPAALGLDLSHGTCRLRRGVTHAALGAPPPARERGSGLGFNDLPSSAAHALRSLNRHRDPGNVVHPPPRPWPGLLAWSEQGCGGELAGSTPRLQLGAIKSTAVVCSEALRGE